MVLEARFGLARWDLVGPAFIVLPVLPLKFSSISLNPERSIGGGSSLQCLRTWGVSLGSVDDFTSSDPNLFSPQQGWAKVNDFGGFMSRLQSWWATYWSFRNHLGEEMTRGFFPPVGEAWWPIFSGFRSHLGGFCQSFIGFYNYPPVIRAEKSTI